MANEGCLGSQGIVNKVELVRAIGEALHSFGYSKTAQQLVEESDIIIRSPAVALFIRQINNGQWDESLRTLPEVNVPDEDCEKLAAFLINEQKYCELLFEGKMMEALNTLRTGITPFCEDYSRIKKLSVLLFCEFDITDETTHQRVVESRKTLLEELQKVLHPAVISDTRLITLVERVLDVQMDNCRFHNSSEISLLADHECGMENIPSQTLQVLDYHSKEVLFLQFSHNGKYLASSSADCSVIIWEVKTDGPVSMKHRLSLHKGSVSSVSWSPDDTQILTCGGEGSVRRWDVASGKCLCGYSKDGVRLISCIWALDQCNIFTGATDESIIKWDLQARVLDTREENCTGSALGISAGGKIITVRGRIAIQLFDWKSPPENSMSKYVDITSFSLSEDRKLVLVSLADAGLVLFTIPEFKMVESYSGHVCSGSVLWCCFGGHKQAYIASGSEDSEVYIWQRSSGDLITSLKGHYGVVNCVSWNPAIPHMLASGSDDCTIRIWGRQQARRRKLQLRRL